MKYLSVCCWWGCPCHCAAPCHILQTHSYGTVESTVLVSIIGLLTHIHTLLESISPKSPFGLHHKEDQIITDSKISLHFFPEPAKVLIS